ncbi:MAG: FKBP-type peptidyl-prolyl cis-trans isomerase [Marinilabilia sp.]
MKRKQLAIVWIAAIVMMAGCNKVPHAGKANLETQLDSLSYAIGFYEANSWKENLEKVPFDTLDYKEVARGFKDSELLDRYLDFRRDQFDTIDVEMFKKGFFNELAYDQSYFTSMTADVYIRKVLEKTKKKKDNLKKEEGNKNLEKGQAFLDKNAEDEDVETLESGLQYEVIEEGNGPTPKASDRVKCTYHGTLLDGTVFDSTVDRGDTATLRVSSVIKGWQEALTMMPQGSKWKLFIPPDLAYGEQGAGDNIGPNETIIFEVNLIDVLDDE